MICNRKEEGLGRAGIAKYEGVWRKDLVAKSLLEIETIR